MNEKKRVRLFLGLVAALLIASGPALSQSTINPACTVRSVDVSGDGEFVAVGWGLNVSVFRTSSDRPLWTYETPGTVDAVVLSDDGRALAIAYNDPPDPYPEPSRGHIAFFENSVVDDEDCDDEDSDDDDAPPVSPEWTFETDHPIDGVGWRALDMSRDGSTIVAGTYRWTGYAPDEVGTIYVFDSAIATPVATHDYPDSIMSVRLSGNGRRFLAGAFHGTMRYYDVDTGLICHAWVYDAYAYYAVALDMDGTTLASGHGWGGRVNVFNSDCRRQATHVTGGTHSSMAMDDSGSIFVVNQYRNPDTTLDGVRCFETDGNLLWYYPTDGDFQFSVDLARDGSLMVSGGLYGNVFLLRPDGVGLPLFTHTMRPDVREVSMSATGRYFAAASFEGELALFSSDPPRMEWSWTTPCFGDGDGDGDGEDEDEDEDEDVDASSVEFRWLDKLGRPELKENRSVSLRP